MILTFWVLVMISVYKQTSRCKPLSKKQTNFTMHNQKKKMNYVNILHTCRILTIFLNMCLLQTTGSVYNELTSQEKDR